MIFRKHLKKKYFRLSFFLFAFFFFFGNLFANYSHAWQKVKRNVLVYYSAREDATDYLNNFTDLFAIFFNYYGYNFKLANIDKGIGEKELRDWADVYVVCQDSLVHERASELCDYLSLISDKKRIILFSLPGAAVKQMDLLEDIGFNVNDVIDGKKILRNSVGENLSRGAEKEFTHDTTKKYYAISPALGRSDAKTYMSVFSETCECPIVASSKNGAFAWAHLLVDTSDKLRRKWLVNPFELSKILLGENKFIVPDPCVQSGNRVAFIHIDGDGFNYKLEYKDSRYSGEIIFDEILKKYRLPVTASLIVYEINSGERGNKYLEKKAAQYLNLPFVEAASHSWFHPFKWERVPVAEPGELNEDTEETDVIEEAKIYNPALKVNKTNLEKEIVESCSYISGLCGKKCAVFCWTGSCNPTPAAIEICDKNGIYNINGGDTRYDGEFKLYTMMAPHYSPNGGFIKYNARYVNEFIMTGHWSAPFTNYSGVIEGFKNTAAPYLMTPINIYYHFYTGTKKESLAALKSVYNYALSAHPSFTNVSGWIERVKGASVCEIKYFSAAGDLKPPKVDPNLYSVASSIKPLVKFYFSNAGKLDTFRWDYEGYPLVSPESGVIGYNTINGSKYISIANVTSGEVYIVDRPPDGMYLKSFTGKVLNVSFDKEKERVLKIEAVANSPIRLVMANARAGYYMVSYKKGSDATSESGIKSNEIDNDLVFDAPHTEGTVEIFLTASTGRQMRLTNFLKKFIDIFNFFFKNPVMLFLIFLYLYILIRNKVYVKKDKKRKRHF